MFWFRELLTNNCIQPRDAIEIEGRTKTFPSMGPLNVSFVKSAALLRRIFWFRDLLINNCIQPRDANVTEGRALTLLPH